MSLRLRFEQSADPVVETSTRVYRPEEGGQQYGVKIFTQENRWEIVEMTTGLTVLKGAAGSLLRCKKFAKRGLISLGISFGKEERKEYVTKHNPAKPANEQDVAS